MVALLWDERRSVARTERPEGAFGAATARATQGLGQSIEKVQAGTRVAEQAGDTIQALVLDVKHVSELMRSIASFQEMPRQRSSPRRPSRKSGVRIRRSLWGSSTAARPRMQRKPWLSGLSGSPRTPSSRPWSDTSTSIPQKVG